jgi:hypothetical protein
MKSASLKSRLIQYAIHGVIWATMAGCSAPVVDPDKDLDLRFGKPVGFQLTGTKIVWIDNPSIPITVSYKAPRQGLFDSTQPPPPPALVKRVEGDTSKLVAMLRRELPAALQAALDKAGVQPGDDYRIEMQPTGADNIRGLRVFVTVKVITREGKNAWTTVLPAKPPSGVFGTENENRAYVENALELLLARMRKVELLK